MSNVIRVTLVDAPGGEPSMLRSTASDGTPELSLDLTALIRLLTAFGPLILSLFTGGFTPATVTALIQALLTILSPADAARVQASLASVQGGPQA